MVEIVGTSNRYLEVDLTTREVKEFQASEEDLKLYLGGKGLGLKYIYDRMPLDADPLGEDNIIAFMMGVLVSTGAPCTGRFAAVTKSPLTGIMTSSSCGGPFGIAFKTAGYDGLLVRGKSETPVTMIISESGVEFKDATHLWGKGTHETQHDLELSPKDGACVIGPAGENKVLYANICSGHRFLGRGGMGAVMGSKNLKAIVAYGRSVKYVPKDKELFDKIRKRAIKYIQNNEFTSKSYRQLGTNYHVMQCNRGGILSVNNFRGGASDRAYDVSGERMKEIYKTTASTCLPCTILCGHKGTYPDGKVHQIPEYETIGLFGPNIGLYDPDLIAPWNDVCSEMGMDTISAGTTISYVMEANEKGLLKSRIKFGSAEGITETLYDIAYRRNEGDDYANGSRWLSEKYGGKDFAIHVKGMEMAAYDPRGSYGQGLNYAVCNRGACHLSSTMFIIEVFFGFLNPYSTFGKHKWVRFFESIYNSVNSMHCCLFTGFAYILEPPIAKYTPKPLLKMTMSYFPDIAMMLMDWSVFSKFFTAVSGIKMGMHEWFRVGDRIQVLERYMNTKMGISAKDDTLPERFLKEGRECDPKKRVVPLEKMVKNYYKVRGYDDNGIPTEKTLKKLKIVPK